MTNEKIFQAILEKQVGSVLSAEDGSGIGDFVLTKEMSPGIAANLSQWWDEKYEGVELTDIYAEKFIDETYPN